jgi:nitrite reductase/ring-hydroxylating ferredoxin subunit
LTERRYPVCALAEIAEGSSRGFSLMTEQGCRDVFVVRKGELVAYLNSCPHTGGPLDWVPDQFLDLDGELIQCATHAALFRISDGLCVHGPCAGQSLQVVKVEVTDGVVWALPA